MIKALVLDFDGLILDTAYPEYHSWQLLYGEFDLPFPIDLWSAGVFTGGASGAHTPYDHLEARLGRSLDRAAIRVRRRAHFQTLMQSETVLPGVQQILTEARSLGLGPSPPVLHGTGSRAIWSRRAFRTALIGSGVGMT